VNKVKLTSQGWVFIALISLFVINIFFYLRNINFNPTSLQVVVESPTGPDPFYMGDILTLNYYSRYANFGAVEIRFNTYGRINSDSLEFRIKEQGQSDWYYQGEYKVDQFQPEKLFPFGFPLIEQSIGRSYQIEIESQRGEPGDGVALSGANPRIVSRHVYGSKLLFSSPQLLAYFVFQKIANLFQFPEFFTSSLIFAAPLLIYLIYLVIGSGVGLFSLVLFVITVIEIFWTPEFYAYLQLSIVFGWLLLMRKHHLTFLASALIGMLLFVLTPLFHLFGLEALTSKLGVWAFWFFSLACFRLGYEIFAHLDRTMTLLQYRKNLIVEVWNTFTIAWLMAIGQVTLMTKISVIRYMGTMRWRRLSTEENHHRLTLIVKRFNAPMINSYLITSWFVSSLIQILVIFINHAFKFGPYIISAWLIKYSINRLSGYVNFFQSFFINDQSDRFWNGAGYYLVVVYLSAAVAFLIVQRKKALLVKTYYLLAVLLTSLYVSRIIFDLATISYRDKPTIWVTRPEYTAEPWVDITIVGRNFGEKPFGGKVYIDGIEQRVIDWRTTEIIFRTNPTTTRTGNLSIKTRRDEPSNSIMFIYTGDR